MNKKNINNPLFTVFTGTYNSELVIERVFESVRNQTMRDFEWIIIDDCSNDNTVLLIENFIRGVTDINLKFIKHKQNRGVPIRRKEAINLAQGKYFVTWDHDDIQANNQLEIYSAIWNEYDSNEIVNIFAKVKDQYGKRLGKLFPQDPYRSDFINMHNEYLVGNRSKGNSAEHHSCVKTKLYKMILQYFEDHPELLRNQQSNGSINWGMLAYLGYDTLYTNQIVRTYFINEAGRTTMSDTSRKKGSDKIYLYKLLWLNYWQRKLKNKSLKWTFRNALAVALYGFLNNLNLSQILKDVKSNANKLLVLILALPAYFLSKRLQN